MAGYGIHRDRELMKRLLPKIEAHLHYRNVDVCAIEEVAVRWYPEAYQDAPARQDRLSPLDDIRCSIAQLSFYRSRIFK